MHKPDFTTFADRTDSCRRCGGTGTTTERDPYREVNVVEPCDLCGGSGHRTIRMEAAE